MSYNSYNANSISLQAQDTFRSNAHQYKMTFVGLRPNTKHKMYLDGEDFTWACRGFGQELGEDILSDSDGIVKVRVYYEIPFSRPSQFEGSDSTSLSQTKAGNQNSRMEDTVLVEWKTWEIKSADGLSSAIFQQHFHRPIVSGDYNKIEQHD